MVQRLVQERFERLGATLQAVLEVNTLDAFRGVVRQGQLGALLPQAALVEARLDTTLAVRSPAIGSAGSLTEGSSLTCHNGNDQDRLNIPRFSTSGSWYETLCTAMTSSYQLKGERREAIG